ncbi:MAG: SPOR domain-containing protein [Sulfuritalea sp.]|nr:SPOR domain-containing protein [Sulfuritalea sp.]
MIDTPTPAIEPDNQPDTDSIDDAVLKKRLLNRILVAAVIVVGLLGSLAIFDFLNAPSPTPDQVAAPQPAPVPMTASMKSNDVGSSDAQKPGEPKPEVLERGVPEESASPSTTLQTLPDEKPLTKPATGRLAMLNRAEPSKPAPMVSEPSSIGSGASERKQERNPASRSFNRESDRKFGLQLGVFSNLENAEDLRAKLEKNGIPASIEARVHAGPFASRAEADAARNKLKELGILDSLLITLKGKGGG